MVIFQITILINKFSLEKSTPISQQITKELQNGKTINDLLKDSKYQPFLLTNLNKVKYYYQHFLSATQDGTLLPWPKILPNLRPQNSAILRWLGMNLFEEKRALRSKQLYLVSEPGMGKTTLSMKISQSIKTYFPSLGEKYFDGLSNEHQLIIFDEFHGAHPLGLMNQILDGQECILPQRYQAFTKKKNIPIILMSNIQPFDVYRKVSQSRNNAFVDRLEIIHVTEFINIFE